jgi:transcriptional regulator with XRE-family HTH domain
MYFGQELKKIRLKYGYGLRRFADLIKIKASMLSNIERGIVQPPIDEDFIYKIHFELLMQEDELLLLQKLQKQNNIFYRKREIGFPMFVQTTDGKPMSEEKYMELYRYINEQVFDNDTDKT